MTDQLISNQKVAEYRPSASKIYTIWGLIVIIWAMYRAYIRAPEWMDELVAKPFVFLGPVIYFVLVKEKRTLITLGLVKTKFMRDVYLGLGFALLFTVEGIIVNLAKYGGLSILPKIPLQSVSLTTAAFLALVTAFSEETLIRGFFYTRLKDAYGNELKAMITSGLMYLLLLVPAIVFLTHLSGATLVIFVMTNLVMSFANTMIFNELKSLTVPVLIHAFWNMAVVLYL